MILWNKNTTFISNLICGFLRLTYYFLRAVLKQVEIPYVLPKFEIVVDDSLAFTVRVYGCYFPEDHPVYLDYRRTVRNISIYLHIY